MRVHIGTSGYNYPEWRGTFYPAEFPASKMFAFYAERFRTVEINYTFYRMPTPKITTAWQAQAPEGFLYTLKAPKRLTHDKRLKETGDTLSFFCDSARVLGSHLGVLLFQLPPNLKCDVPRLEAFLRDLPTGRASRVRVSVMNRGWCQEVFDALSATVAWRCASPTSATSRRRSKRPHGTATSGCATKATRPPTSSAGPASSPITHRIGTMCLCISSTRMKAKAPSSRRSSARFSRNAV